MTFSSDFEVSIPADAADGGDNTRSNSPAHHRDRSDLSELEPFLKTDTLESSTGDLSSVTVGKRAWRNRRNRCFRRCTNGQCCLWSCGVWLSATFFIFLPLLFLVIIPQSVRFVIDSAPPAYINVIDIQRMYSHNASAGLWFQADLSLQGPSAYFYPAAYHVSLLAPGEKNGMHLGLMDLGGFSSSLTEKMSLDFYSVFHDANDDNMRKAFKVVSSYLTKSFGGLVEDSEPEVEEPVNAADRVSNKLWRLRMATKAHADILGVGFNNIYVKYDIGLNYDTKTFLQRFQPELVSCMVNNGEPMTCDDFIATLPKGNLQNGLSMLGDDEEGEFTIETVVSIVNPTVFGLHLGSLKMDITVPGGPEGEREVFLEASVANFVVNQTHRSHSIRQELKGKVVLKEVTPALRLINAWKAGKKGLVTVDNFRMNGYPANAEEEATGIISSGRISWMEDLLKEFSITLGIAKPDTLP